ncbi:hypothetical protein ACFQX9_22690 [Bradyrhizobium sp. GCM10028915]|uniref:hypothetical protein n=1 Tax=Bradyrhizobium sp. GCM10028915 TaxID=3273385 RepID=UPI0036193B60
MFGWLTGRKKTYADTEMSEDTCYWRILGFVGDKATSNEARDDFLVRLRSVINTFKEGIHLDQYSFSEILSRLNIQQAAALGAKQQAVAVHVWNQRSAKTALMADCIMLTAILLLHKGKSSTLPPDRIALIKQMVMAADPPRPTDYDDDL